MNSLDFQALGQLRADAAQTVDAKNNPALRKTAEQFEAMFLQMMLKTMREASEANKEDLFGNNASKTYEELFDKEIAQQMAKRGGVGLADMMIQSFDRQAMATPATLGQPAAAEVLAARQTELGREGQKKGLPIQKPLAALPLRQEAAAGLALPRPTVKTELDRDRLTVGSRAVTAPLPQADDQ